MLIVVFVESSFIDKMESKVFYSEQQPTQVIRVVKMVQTSTNTERRSLSHN